MCALLPALPGPGSPSVSRLRAMSTRTHSWYFLSQRPFWQPVMACCQETMLQQAKKAAAATWAALASPLPFLAALAKQEPELNAGDEQARIHQENSQPSMKSGTRQSGSTAPATSAPAAASAICTAGEIPDLAHLPRRGSSRFHADTGNAPYGPPGSSR